MRWPVAVMVFAMLGCVTPTVPEVDLSTGSCSMNLDCGLGLVCHEGECARAAQSQDDCDGSYPRFDAEAKLCLEALPLCKTGERVLGGACSHRQPRPYPPVQQLSPARRRFQGWHHDWFVFFFFSFMNHWNSFQ